MKPTRLNPHTRGDTFIISIELENAQEEPLTLAPENIKSQIRTSNGVLIADLVISQTDTPGQYILQHNETQNWPTADVFMDIQINEGGTISSSPVYVFRITRDVTRDE